MQQTINTINICMLGDGGCGKTSAVDFWRGFPFQEKNQPNVSDKHTCNIKDLKENFQQHDIDTDNLKSSIKISDTGGQLEFEELQKLDIFECDVVCLLIDCSAKGDPVHTLRRRVGLVNSVNEKRKNDNKHMGDPAKIVVGLSRIDLVKKDETHMSELKRVKAVLKDLGLEAVEISAKSGENMWELLAKCYRAASVSDDKIREALPSKRRCCIIM